MNPRARMGLKMALGAVLLALPLVVEDRYFMHLLITSGIFVLLASSWNLLTGFAGLLNLGHAAFYGIGAYTSAILATKLGLNPWLGLLMGGLVAGLFGLMLGVPSLRLSGPYLAITTIGFSEILRLVAMNWVELTRGSLGLYGIPPLPGFSLGDWLVVDFRHEMWSYYLILALVGISLWAIRRLTISQFGLTIKSLREDDVAAGSIGVDIAAYKLAVFTISAFFAGVAGAFFAHYQRLVSPDTLSLGETFAILTMVMVGGLGTLPGPVLGAILLTFLSEWLRFLEDFVKLDVRMVIYGLLLVLTILFMRGGMVGLWQRLRAAYARKG
ncbi:MAG: branched-chain amino acid ABC transporter permease [Pseudomonadota bacterium]